jgi:16S rRNA (cytidine1402-2'-O)-methyltransferase
MERPSFPPGLYVAATPLGHLGDITDRVRAALENCDLIFAEDTRHTLALLRGLGLHRSATTVRPLHQHNERDVIDQLLDALSRQRSVMLVSDAGTPAISDPGALAVDAAWRAGFTVTPLPGPSAVITALSVCGFTRWPMSFWGFSPAKPSARRTWLQLVKRRAGLAVIFETPHRAGESLADCEDVFGSDTPMMFGRELTKQYETIVRGSIREVREKIECLRERDPASAKGEMVWVFDLGSIETDETAIDRAKLEQWAAVLGKEMPAATAARCLVKMLGVRREDAYAAVRSTRDDPASDTTTPS